MLTPEQTREVVSLAAQGISQTRIAKQVGCNRKAVSRILEKVALDQLPEFNASAALDDLKAKAWTALDETLEDPDAHPYERAHIGVSTLKASGAFDSKQVDHIAAIPAETWAFLDAIADKLGLVPPSRGGDSSGYSVR